MEGACANSHILFPNIEYCLYTNSGELIKLYNNNIDPTDGYNSIYSYGIRTKICPLLYNNISINAITFYRKINDESHSKIYLTLIFTYYNQSNSNIQIIIIIIIMI